MPASDLQPSKVPEFFSPQVREARRFYLDLNPSRRQPLAVVCGGFERATPDYAIHRPGFPYLCVEFVAHGKGTLVLSGQEMPLRPGSIFTFGPEVPQDITTDRNEPLAKYSVNFVGRRGAGLLRRHGLSPGTKSQVFAPLEIQRVFDELIATGLKSTPLTAPMCAALLEYLLLKIADSRSAWEAGQTPAFATYERCRQFIEANHASLTGLPQIAQKCRVSAAHLCRLFRRYGHQTPFQFLMRLKMNHAAQRMQDPGVLVKQVAAELGFDDPFHFSRAFKNVMGLSPRAFRRLH